MANEPTEQLKHAKDFEEGLGNGAVRIYEGNPRYCPERRRHEPHRFEYRYLDSHDEEWKGDYLCDGEPMTFARRP